MADRKNLEKVAREVERRLARAGVVLTMGGEPTYLPSDPSGAEWSYEALGPEKLGRARAFAVALRGLELPSALILQSPGKQYPGEPSPRWSVRLLYRKDGAAFAGRLAAGAPDRVTARAFGAFHAALASGLGLAGAGLKGRDPLDGRNRVFVLPLDREGDRWATGPWGKFGGGKPVTLLRAEGPAGLRLPLGELPEGSIRRALVAEWSGGRARLFLPPLDAGGFFALLDAAENALAETGFAVAELHGYLPHDLGEAWEVLSITPDPGVIEVNLPPCGEWARYADWLERLERAAGRAGLRSWRMHGGDPAGTGGGNHLLFGGPEPERSPFFTRPRWVAAVAGYWRKHPALSYLFTGMYVGRSSQAPRPDEAAMDPSELDLAYAGLAALPEGDHRAAIGEALRHLHVDASGNTHRSEISVDKFWNPIAPNGCLGLVEFRAIESAPHASWMGAVALLWRALLVFLLERPERGLGPGGGAPDGDRWFLPELLWRDLASVLGDLKEAGFPFPEGLLRAFWEWRFPRRLTLPVAGGDLVVRKGLESWPLMAEMPVRGGLTSRFVDSSLERLEIVAPRAFAGGGKVYANGRLLPLRDLGEGIACAGLRYRRSNLFPSLHPHIPPQLPLRLAVVAADGAREDFAMGEGEKAFRPVPPEGKLPGGRSLSGEGMTSDLRV